MLFAWIDKHQRLDDQAGTVIQSGRIGPFPMWLTRHGSALVGVGSGNPFPITQHTDGDRVTCFRGVLNNADELRSEAPSDPGRPAGTVAPAAVVARMLRDGHPDALERIDGPFSLIHWDRQARRLIAATDRFATLPLRYYEDADRLIVASDGRMILACPGVSTRLDPQAVYDYVAMSIIPTPLTIYRQVRKLPARHALVHDESTTVRPYERIDWPEDASGTQDEIAARVLETIDRAVARRRRVDEPDRRIGAFLSGGLDSSTVVGVLARQEKRSVRAYSIGFAEARFNELGYAKLAARHFHASLHVGTVSDADTLETLDALLDEYDEPFGNSSAIPVYGCAKLAAESGIATLYAGDGGDELFAGNPHYLWDRYFQVYHNVPWPLRRGLIEPVVNHWPLGSRIRLVRKARSYLRRANTPNPDRITGYGFLETVPPDAVFRTELLAAVDTDHPMAVRRGHFNEPETRSELYRILHHELALVLADNDLRKVTAMSARAGVRVVYPMLDRDLVRLVGRIPAAWHLQGFKLRALYKRAVRGFLPDAILTKEKMGFGLPVSVWLRQEGPLRRRMLETFSRPAARAVFARDFLPALQQRLDADTTNYYGSIAWVLMVLVDWLDRSGRWEELLDQ